MIVGEVDQALERAGGILGRGGTSQSFFRYRGLGL